VSDRGIDSAFDPSGVRGFGGAFVLVGAGVVGSGEVVVVVVSVAWLAVVRAAVGAGGDDSQAATVSSTQTPNAVTQARRADVRTIVYFLPPPALSSSASRSRPLWFGF
jgi:hypothetical protein